VPEDEDPVPELSEVPELTDDSAPPELFFPGLLLPDDFPLSDCEVPPPLLPALPLSPLRWHADSVPTTSKGRHSSASHRFIAALIYRILSKSDQYFAAPELLLPPVALSELPGMLLSVPVAPEEVPPDVEPPPDVPPDLLPSVAPVPAGGVAGSVLGVFAGSDGGVDAAGAEELGVVLLVPPVVP
jgi:hypothetical protein